MGTSYDFHNDFVKNFVELNYCKHDIILDIGAGAGKYGKMFNPNFHIEALEVFEPNITNHNLRYFYKEVFNVDARTFPYLPNYYSLAIMGDVLEHLYVQDAKKVLESIYNAGIDCLVLVPYEYEQDILYGNEAEIHHQPDLTPEVFKSRYPEFNLIHGNNLQGVYFRKGKKIE